MSKIRAVIFKRKMKHLFSTMKSDINTAFCDHRFSEYGHGWKCTRCDEYTGMDKELNDILLNLEIDYVDSVSNGYIYSIKSELKENARQLLEKVRKM